MSEFGVEDRKTELAARYVEGANAEIDLTWLSLGAFTYQNAQSSLKRR
jgi:hypothetical protein